MIHTTMIHTTFKLLHEAGACRERYRHLAEQLGGVDHYGEDTPIPLTVILDKNGIGDAEWVLSESGTILEGEAKRDALYADYEAKCAPLYADYVAKRNALYREAVSQ